MLGDNIKKIMKDKRFTSKELADMVNVTPTHISYVINNKRDPSMELLSKIADVLGVSVNEFFDGENTKPHQDNIKLTKKDEKDIEKALSNTLSQLENAQDGLMFDGEPIDDETRELLRISLENSMRLAKQIAKKKYTPNKYKK
ncbi:helix-turn-helix domain-containing protein [Clostridium cochlearium]|uniref:helix-turn-helix domain-containing protein n=1 Tax=Clostridium cochlearium TaxID=1494 RepID=UPI000BBCA6C9|nr:helix-turn-helix transcriptional regulator [Clostridium cochlearium]